MSFFNMFLVTDWIKGVYFDRWCTEVYKQKLYEGQIVSQTV